ncbi:LutC/YkgG family protein [Aneurinibacillus tyrosinisolvens]|uniref:LutC/YkgG family protein n=1 Tax=Aneurinibacillus tyrosinisolvens TaxID=1443435 RepID=UPI00063EE5CE|nr:lactate utilization protein C [Aneurinibacillus tyrosinisolvens]
MNKNSTDIIRQLDEQAAKKEADFLDHIASRLQRSRVTKAPDHPFRGAPAFWNSYELDGEKRVELFMANWKNLGGAVERFPTKDALRLYIAEFARTMQAKYMVRFEHPLLEEIGLEPHLPGVEITVWNKDTDENLMAKAAGADIGIAVVDYGIAHTGTVVAVSGEKQGRSVSLLPTVFIAIVRSHDIKTRMGEVMTDLEKRFGHKLPAGIHFITGPSRSSDIENDLTIGVHGPGIVHALILD